MLRPGSTHNSRSPSRRCSTSRTSPMRRSSGGRRRWTTSTTNLRMSLCPSAASLCSWRSSGSRARSRRTRVARVALHPPVVKHVDSRVVGGSKRGKPPREENVMVAGKERRQEAAAATTRPNATTSQLSSPWSLGKGLPRASARVWRSSTCRAGR